MILITSAAYVNPSLVAEFGSLPPCMLPVQNKRLYMHQVALCSVFKEHIYLSLPKSYILPDFDKQWITENDITVIFVPDKLELGQSIIYSLNIAGRFGEPLRLLHGDTLFSKLPIKEDSCLTAIAEDNYSWAPAEEKSRMVYAGYFSFSSQSLLIKEISNNNYSFIEGVEAYNIQKSLAKEESNSWLDFSLVNSYYRSISNLTTQRSFNDIKGSRFSLIKSSRDKNKMRAEANWLQSLPKHLLHYVPAIWDEGETSEYGYYELEYFYLSSLANLYVFGHHPQFVWSDIMTACLDFLNDTYRCRPDKNISAIASMNNELFLPKTRQRLGVYADKTGISLDHKWCINGEDVPSLREIIEETGAMIEIDRDEFVTLMHGDFCFSNILYDFKSKSIKVIDPRGLDPVGNISIYGDFRYDVGKLAHSILGLYDFIIGGIFKYRENNTYDIELEFDITDDIKAMQSSFKEQCFGEYNIRQLSTYPIMIHLFLSMLPLHDDRPLRQKAMIANALRLYVDYKKNKL